MALPVSGAISFNAINVELGVAGTTQASLNQASYRTLAGVPSGAISMSNFYGKANQFAFTISSPQTNADLRTLAVNAGWPGSSQVIATINPGVVMSSNSTGVSALTVSGAFPAGVRLNNNGTIVGRGGDGGRGGKPTPSSFPGLPGAAGGPALAVSVALTLDNLGTIAGGGGGGGGGEGRPGTPFGPRGGGGGGGGRSSLTNSAGGAGGPSPNAAGLPGGPGTFSGAGAGGAGGGFGTPGANGGGWGASGGASAAPSPYAGGGGGSAISGNPSITYVNTGTRLGPIS